MHTQADPADAANDTPGSTTNNASEASSDLYEVLQVSPKAEPEVIEAAYKKLALKYHPDRNSNVEATARMQELNAAYAVLGHAHKRANYDRSRAGLPPLDFDFFDFNEAGAASDFRSEPVASSDGYVYDWDDLPFAAPKAGIVSPRRGWVHLKVFVHRHRRQLLPYTIALILLLLLVFMWLTQNTADSSSLNIYKPGTTGQQTPPLLVTNFSENFEDAAEVAQDWTLDAPWHVTNRLAASGTGSLWVGDERNHQYGANVNASVTLNHLLDFSQIQHPLLSFKLNGQFDDETNPNGRDRLFVEIAEPGHDFETVYSISSTFTNWQLTQIDLSRWKGKTVLLRFRFQSSAPSLGYTGPFIDDIIVAGS